MFIFHHSDVKIPYVAAYLYYKEKLKSIFFSRDRARKFFKKYCSEREIKEDENVEEKL